MLAGIRHRKLRSMVLRARRSRITGHRRSGHGGHIVGISYRIDLAQGQLGYLRHVARARRLACATGKSQSSDCQNEDRDCHDEDRQ